jgi:hypothetical protein
MNLAETIVARLLNEEYFDVHQRPDLFLPANGVDSSGRKIVRVCGECEKEYGSDRQYPSDVSMSHGPCLRHAARMYMSQLGYSEEQARAKVAGKSAPPDWSEALGQAKEQADPQQQQHAIVWNPHKEDATPPKATFWATSGSGGV